MNYTRKIKQRAQGEKELKDRMAKSSKEKKVAKSSRRKRGKRYGKTNSSKEKRIEREDK
jgi:hypothetical protein